MAADLPHEIDLEARDAHCTPAPAQSDGEDTQEKGWWAFAADWGEVNVIVDEAHAELFNAISMGVPYSVCFIALDNPCSAWVAVAFAMICPVSIMLHLGCYFGRIADVVDNDFRRLDQTLQCTACVLVCAGLGGGAVEVLCTAAISLYTAFHVWNPVTTNDMRRWEPIALAVLASFTPMLSHRQWGSYAAAVGTCGLSAALFCLESHFFFRVYGHSLFHIFMGCVVAIVSNAASDQCIRARVMVG